MKILIDVNLTPDWAAFLGQAGFECEHWTHIGAPNARDTEIMEYARTGGFVIFTHDLDLGHVLALTMRDVGLGYLRLGRRATRCRVASPSGSSWWPSWRARRLRC